MAMFGWKLACALFMFNVMTRVCHAGSASGYCPVRTCGTNADASIRFPFRLLDDALSGRCYSSYPALMFQCMDGTLYLNFTGNLSYSSDMYKVAKIDYWNQTLSLAPHGYPAICRPFDASRFGGLNITNTTTLLLDCATDITGQCTKISGSSFSNACNSTGGGVNTEIGDRWTCPMTLNNYKDPVYSTCYLVETPLAFPNDLLGSASTVLELQFAGNRTLSLTNFTSPPVQSPGAAPTSGESSDVAVANAKAKKRRLYIILGVVSGFLAAVIIFLLVMLFWCRRSRYAGDSVKYDDKKAFEKIRSNGSGHLTQLFSYKELDHATQGFSAKQELGGGGFGTVYRGRLADGRMVAVKKLNQGGSQGIQQFLNEVEVLSKVRHPHLVQLLGCCMERPLLVYEYVPNGSISMHLHGDYKADFPWDTRLEIAIQTAEALAYLHFLVDPPIFHRDVKTTNILLDKDFKAKIADFGLSRLVVNMENTHISTAPQGTPGYLDPDYHESYHLSDKSDVYSFGVVLMELVTAKKAVDMARERKEINLASLAVAKIHSGSLHEIIDPDLIGVFPCYPEAQVMVEQVAELAFRCLAPEKDDRPSMKEVLAELQRTQTIGFGARASKKLESESSFDNKDSAKPLIKKDAVWPTSPTSVQDVWVSTTTSPADSIAEMA
ncbi:hypothetical protein KC19_2G167600 [Ceratodon purpureus]|uniref:Protein kinase domain-containing protein n=1 Tax=Ceratodon purpureus TaxID=3225 RepID=A0A8T0IWK1_CERPU|nr:hypothetical protein KC19_2G167600 [Ceratodon purpureus]